MTVPVLNLDLTGTLIPTGGHRAFGEPVVRVYTRRQRLWAYRRVLGRIVALHEQGLADVRILTDHPDMAHELVRLLGLPTWPVRHGTQPAHGAWWKEHVVREDLAEGRHVVWIGHEIQTRADDRGLHLAYPGQILTLSPHPSRGVTLGGLDRVRDWLIAHRDSLMGACA